MTKSWTLEEWKIGRRIVQFNREQKGKTIRCQFNSMAQEDATSNSTNTVVSCIYWKDQKEFFITSVDCIYLLEALMDIKFSVEEKNRIRRNLEGFRPMTVSKCKVDTSDFFKQVMGFPKPKPRNIEKDIKVFPWKALPYALKKIITKYTAIGSSLSGHAIENAHTSLSDQNTINRLSLNENNITRKPPNDILFYQSGSN